MAAAAFSSVSVRVVLPLGVAATESVQLSATFYDSSCPRALATIRSAVTAAVRVDPRMGASLLRLDFHDCFVSASLLVSSLFSAFRYLLQIVCPIGCHVFPPSLNICWL
jgi:hypothetical protein